MTQSIRPLLEPDLDPGSSASEPETNPRVSVIVPVTERPSPLEWLYGEFAPALKERGIAYEFLFLVEPWGRGMAKGLRGLINSGEPIRVFEVGQSVGESAMLEAARRHVRGEILLTLPAYPRVRPEGLIGLLDAIDEGADLVTAQRVPLQTSWLNRIQNRVFHALLQFGIGGSFNDVASGVRAMRRDVLEEIPIYGDLFRFLPILAEREGFHVEELPLAQHEQDSRTRIYAPGVYLRRVIDLLGLFFVVRFTRKPLRFFGLVGVIVWGLGLLMLGVLFVQRLYGQAVADRPMLLLGALLFVLGVQAIAIGLIGEIIVHLSASGGRREYRVREQVRALD